MFDLEATERMLRGMYQELVKINFLLLIIALLIVVHIFVTWLDGHLYRKHDLLLWDRPEEVKDEKP